MISEHRILSVLASGGAASAVSGGIELSVKQATVMLDEGWSPYCQATLVCSIPEEVELIDPRSGVRIQFTLQQRFANDSDVPYNSIGARPVNSRTFDLGLRQRTVDHVTGELTLALSSDEALLQDYALVADEPLNMETVDVAAIVDLVLAYIGAEVT